ncbi:MAG TPA: alpha/beta hydrolase [Longimicrobiaceae bacterium]
MSRRESFHDPVREGAGYDPHVDLRGSGPPLVLVPGMDGTGRLFHRQVPGLARSHRVATYALRDRAGSMEELVDDLDGVIRRAAPRGEPATVVGESFGGTLALSFALARPERVAALVVLNSFPYFRPRVRLRLAMAGIRMIPWGAMPLVRRATAFRLHSRFTGDAEIRRFLDVTRATTKEGYLARLRILTRYDVRARLGEIRAPTLFLAAEMDHLVPSVEQARWMAERVPGAALRVLEGHGHICMIAPGLDLARLLREWREDREETSQGVAGPAGRVSGGG